MRRTVLGLTCVLALLTGCRHEGAVLDLTPMPTAAAPPYLCGYIPQRAVELMTGVRNPIARGYFDLTAADGIGFGDCAIYQRDGERGKILQISLTPGGYAKEIEEQLRLGASPLPEIIPGAIGSYYRVPNSTGNDANALLVRGKAELGIDLIKGVQGRDGAADVVALMKLIAPKLITDASAPSPSPSAKASATGKD